MILSTDSPDNVGSMILFPSLHPSVSIHSESVPTRRHHIYWIGEETTASDSGMKTFPRVIEIFIIYR